MTKHLKIIALFAFSALIVYLAVDLFIIQKGTVAGRGARESSFKPFSPEIINRDQYLIRKLTEGRTPVKGKWKGIRHAIRTTGHRAAITGLLFLDQGKKLVSSSRDKTVKIWDVSNIAHPSLIHTYRKFNDSGELTPFLSMSKSKNAKLFGLSQPWSVAYDNRQALEVFDLETGLINIIPCGYLTSFAFSEDGRCIASGMIDGSVRIQRVVYLASGKLNTDIKYQFTFHDHKGSVTAVAFSQNRFASASEDNTVRLYKYSYDRFILQKIIEFSDKVTALAFSPDSRFLLTASADKRICLYSQDGDFEREFAILNEIPKSLYFSPDGKSACILSASPLCFLYSFPEGESIAVFEGHSSPMTAIASTWKDGELYFASGDQLNGEILFLNKRGLAISKIEGDSSQVFALGIADDLQIGMGMVPNGLLHQSLDLKTLDLLPLTNEAGFSKRIGSSGGYFVERPSPSFDRELPMRANALDIFSPLSRARILRTELDGYDHTCFTFLDDYHLAIGGRNGSLCVYTRNGYKVLNLIGHEGDILDLAYSRKEKWLVSSSSDGTIMLWSLQSLGSPSVLNLRDIDWSLLEGRYYSKPGLQAIKEKLFRLSNEDINKRSLTAYLLFLAHGTPNMNPMVTLFFTKGGQWILWNNRGLFASKTEELWDTVGYFTFVSLPEDNPEFIPYSQMLDCFFRPEIIVNLVNIWLENPMHRDTTDIPLYRIQESGVFKDPPPLLQIVRPKEGDVVDTETVDVQVNIENPYGMIGDIRLYHNGKLVFSNSIYEVYREGSLGLFKMYMLNPKIPTSYDNFAPSLGPLQKYFKVNLVPGENIIACQAGNSSNKIFSTMAKVYLKCSMEEQLPKLYLLTVGIKNFKNPDYNLKAPHKDAQGVARILGNHRKSDFAGYEVVELLDPSKQKILESIFELKNIIQPEDTFIFFTSTHGYAAQYDWSPEDHYEYYLITSDCSDSPTEDVTISTRELLEISKLIPALNQVYILDTCQSGAAHKEFSKIYNQKLMIFGMGGGMHIMAASSPLEYALDSFDDYGYSLFTNYLLEALQGLGDTDNDGVVTLSEATLYIQNQIQQQFEGIQKGIPKPEIFCYGPSQIIAER